MKIRLASANGSEIAGAFGLEVALSLARQGVTFRIIGKLRFLGSQTFDCRSVG